MMVVVFFLWNISSISLKRILDIVSLLALELEIIWIIRYSPLRQPVIIPERNDLKEFSGWLLEISVSKSFSGSLKTPSKQNNSGLGRFECFKLTVQCSLSGSISIDLSYSSLISSNTTQHVVIFYGNSAVFILFVSPFRRVADAILTQLQIIENEMIEGRKLRLWGLISLVYLLINMLIRCDYLSASLPQH